MPWMSKADTPVGLKRTGHARGAWQARRGAAAKRAGHGCDADGSGTLQALLEALQSLDAGDFPVRRPGGRRAAEIGVMLDSIAATIKARGVLRRPQRPAERDAELERRVAERLRERETALAEAHELQKIESLGQLAGGAAHDFNNVLMAILGNLDLIALTLAGDAGAQRLVDGAIRAAERGAALTRRMLAFARRQDLHPEAVDIARRIGGMVERLRRALGPTIEIGVAVEDNLAPVRVDPGQLELAILDLALNARDAMPQGGRLTIAARRAAGRVPGLAAGEYVSIILADTGAGMDENTLKRAPEPFYTTKEVGRGTGLGLSTVYGLAAQSGGAALLSSRPGAGTAVELILPVANIGEPRSPRAPVGELARALACLPPG